MTFPQFLLVAWFVCGAIEYVGNAYGGRALLIIALMIFGVLVIFNKPYDGPPATS